MFSILQCTIGKKVLNKCDKSVEKKEAKEDVLYHVKDVMEGEMERDIEGKDILDKDMLEKEPEEDVQGEENMLDKQDVREEDVPKKDIAKEDVQEKDIPMKDIPEKDIPREDILRGGDILVSEDIPGAYKMTKLFQWAKTF